MESEKPEPAQSRTLQIEVDVKRYGTLNMVSVSSRCTDCALGRFANSAIVHVQRFTRISLSVSA